MEGRKHEPTPLARAPCWPIKNRGVVCAFASFAPSSCLSATCAVRKPGAGSDVCVTRRSTESEDAFSPGCNGAGGSMASSVASSRPRRGGAFRSLQLSLWEKGTVFSAIPSMACKAAVSWVAIPRVSMPGKGVTAACVTCVTCVTRTRKSLWHNSSRNWLLRPDASPVRHCYGRWRHGNAACIFAPGCVAALTLARRYLRQIRLDPNGRRAGALPWCVTANH